MVAAAAAVMVKYAQEEQAKKTTSVSAISAAHMDTAPPAPALAHNMVRLSLRLRVPDGTAFPYPGKTVLTRGFAVSRVIMDIVRRQLAGPSKSVDLIFFLIQ